MLISVILWRLLCLLNLRRGNCLSYGQYKYFRSYMTYGILHTARLG
jgi:hypothetical protein